MRYAVVLGLLASTRFAPPPKKTVQTFPLPKPTRITMARRVDCHAITSTLISEHGGNVETEINAGTDHLTIVRVREHASVTAHHDSAQVADDADIYRITSETVDFISAVQGLKPLPVVHGLVMDKRLGSAVWTESDSTFVFVSD